MQPVVFPGRQTVLDRFRQILAAGKLSQTYLFVGPEGAGKEATALEIARLANCPREPACAGEPFCESCQKAATFQHPDIRWIGPAPATLDPGAVRELLDAKQQNPFHQAPFSSTSQVTIGHPDDPGPLTVRSLLRFLRLHPFQGRYKVAVVSDSHRLTRGAANSFLKTLEEPPSASLIFLLTSNRSALLPTIVSRCQQVRFELYGRQELADLLVDLGAAEAAEAERAARTAAGNARLAMALLEPQARALQNWAEDLFGLIHAGRSGSVLLAADQLHAGVIPAEMAAGGAGKELPAAKEPAARRERAFQLCEMLNLYWNEMLLCREQQDDWEPRLPEAADRVRQAARDRRTTTLLGDIARIEAVKGEIDGNLNIGLCLAVLLQGLIDHAQKDQVAAVG